MKTFRHADTLFVLFFCGSALLTSSLTSAWASPSRTVSGHHVAAAPGLIEPAGEEREIGSEVVGVVREMRVDENQQVKAGEIIAVIDNSEQLARAATAKAEVSLRQAELERLVNGARAEEKREARAALSEAEASLDLARREYDRRLPLAKSGASPQSALDQATSNLNGSKARRAAMAEKLAVLETGPRGEDISAARARLRLAEANLALAEAMLEKTFVRSPISGTILRRLRVAGETVSSTPPTPIAIIGDLHGLRVRAEVDETDVGRVGVGQRVEVVADAFPDKKFGGAISRVSSRMGAKQVQTGRPTDRVDAKVLQVMIDLDAGTNLPVGLRVDAYFLRGGIAARAE